MLVLVFAILVAWAAVRRSASGSASCRGVLRARRPRRDRRFPARPERSASRVRRSVSPSAGAEVDARGIRGGGFVANVVAEAGVGRDVVRLAGVLAAEVGALRRLSSEPRGLSSRRRFAPAGRGGFRVSRSAASQTRLSIPAASASSCAFRQSCAPSRSCGPSASCAPLVDRVPTASRRRRCFFAPRDVAIAALAGARNRRLRRCPASSSSSSR